MKTYFTVFIRFVKRINKDINNKTLKFYMKDFNKTENRLSNKYSIIIYSFHSFSSFFKIVSLTRNKKYKCSK